MKRIGRRVAVPLFLCVAASAQHVSQVVTQSTLTTNQVSGAASLFSIFTTSPNTTADPRLGNFGSVVTTPSNYAIANASLGGGGNVVASALSANIAVALSVIPLSSPSSGVIEKRDPDTGATLVSSTLGPIFTQRAESVGKGKFYLGFTHQAFHFTELNGQSLNGLSVLYSGGDASGVVNPNGNKTATAPATVNFGLDVRLAQDIVFLTYGVTNKVDVSVGLPAVHAAVASRSYNGIVYTGTGNDFSSGNQCWCINTLTPGTPTLNIPDIGLASASKSGFGDLLLRGKATVVDKSHVRMATGLDLRLPTGDADNLLGTGTTSVKPFVTVSLYSSPIGDNIIIAPHFDLGWQVSGKSVLGGTQAGTVLSTGGVPVVTTPIVSTKDNIPDVFTWTVGTEIALGRRNTVIFDVLGNQIGLVNGAQLLRSQDLSSLPNKFNTPPGVSNPQTYGLVSAGRGSFGQYSAAFGYKARLFGNLVGTFQALVRMNDEGLTARFVPLYGLGYSF
jgi:hypothetical protein